MINYQGKREAKEMLEFLQQDFSEDPLVITPKEGEEKSGRVNHIKDIPAELTALQDMIDGLKKDAIQLYKYKKNALIGTLGVGFLLGWLVRGCVSGGAKAKQD